MQRNSKFEDKGKTEKLSNVEKPKIIFITPFPIFKTKEDYEAFQKSAREVEINELVFTLFTYQGLTYIKNHNYPSSFEGYQKDFEELNKYARERHAEECKKSYGRSSENADIEVICGIPDNETEMDALIEKFHHLGNQDIVFWNGHANPTFYGIQDVAARPMEMAFNMQVLLGVRENDCPHLVFWACNTGKSIEREENISSSYAADTVKELTNMDFKHISYAAIKGVLVSHPPDESRKKSLVDVRKVTGAARKLPVKESLQQESTPTHKNSLKEVELESGNTSSTIFTPIRNQSKARKVYDGPQTIFDERYVNQISDKIETVIIDSPIKHIAALGNLPPTVKRVRFTDNLPIEHAIEIARFLAKLNISRPEDVQIKIMLPKELYEQKENVQTKFTPD